MQNSAILLTFIKLPFVIKTFVLSIFEWLLITCFTVHSHYIKIVRHAIVFSLYCTCTCMDVQIVFFDLT